MTPSWEPDATRIRTSNMTRFTRELESRIGRPLANYAALHRLSIDDPAAFWFAMWDFAGVLGERGDRAVVDFDRLHGARFFPDAQLGFTENVLMRGDEQAPAIFAVTEDGREQTITRGELRRDVARAAGALRAAGVSAGDRVAGIVANTPEAIVAALAAAAIGAVWSSCSPDFGVRGVLDRFGQIEPVVLVAVVSHQYGGKTFDHREKIRDVAAHLPTLRQVVVIDDPGRSTGAPPLTAAIGRIDAVDWHDWLASGDPLALTSRYDFNHPLYILYSSGTTGVPKCIVHGAGGTLLQHLKEHQLHCDIKPGDRVFYFTTCGWMMWNWLVTVLASDATIVLYDGAPFHPDARRLFDLVDRATVTLFGVSAKYIDAVNKSGIEPRTSHSLQTMKTMTSTGSPLAPESFDVVYSRIKRDVHLASISGGTDIVSCFVGGNPNLPVWRGEIQVPGLAMDVDVFDASGRPTNEPGELVCKSPFPSMPVGFWNDPDGRKYHDAYFERFPGVWRHGDWVKWTAHGGMIIYGRSDATLNPGGVRIGTAEIYRQVEQLPEVLESLAVGQQWDGDERVVLFVRLAPPARLDEPLRARIATQIRANTSPRHVPARIIQIADIPRTKSGKIVELAVRDVIHGRDVNNRDALANPEALDLYRDLPDLRS